MSDQVQGAEAEQQIQRVLEKGLHRILHDLTQCVHPMSGQTWDPHCVVGARALAAKVAEALAAQVPEGYECRYCGIADGPPAHVYGERKCCPDCDHRPVAASAVRELADEFGLRRQHWADKARLGELKRSPGAKREAGVWSMAEQELRALLDTLPARGDANA